MEVWKDIAGHEGLYQVSDLGRVKSLLRKIWVNPNKSSPNGHFITIPEKLLSPTTYKGERGCLYEKVTLWDHHVGRQAAVQILVCEAFHGPRPEGHYACHRDGDGLNNRSSNLYWGTPLENAADTKRHGRQVMGEAIPWSVLTEDNVREIRRLAGSMSQREIGEKFGVGQPRISRILSGEQWRHVA